MTITRKLLNTLLVLLILPVVLSACGGGSGSTDLPILPENDATKNHLGMNTWFLNDWDGSYAFVDAMKHARPWRDGADWNKPVAGVDAFGWPTADASTVVITGSPAQLNGKYKLIFNGQAELSALFYSIATFSNKVYDAATNTTSVDVTYTLPADGYCVGLVFRNTRRTATSATNTGFTNVHLYRPGYPSDGSQVFATPFLNALGKVGVVRMMDWTATNQNLTQHWSQRTTPYQSAKPGPSYTGPGGTKWSSSDSGVALEHQIQLCNALHSDCWINIPVVADDDYVKKIAQALRYGTDGTNPYVSHQDNPVFPSLDPNLRVYVEYANEIWNSAGGFESFYAIKDIVGSLPGNHELNKPAEDNVYARMWRYPAYRLAFISDVFRIVYGDASMMNRVRPVLMTQQGNAQATLEIALNWLDAYAKRQTLVRSVDSYLYGAGGSGYYNVNNEPADKTDVNGYFAAGNYPATQNVLGMGVDAVWAANFGLKRVAYEGGPSLDAYTRDVDARAINADARMQDMIVKTHNAWSANGGDLLVYYTLVGPPMWEFTPDVTNTSTPKFKGIDQLKAQPRVAATLGQQLPGEIVAASQANYRIRTGYDYPVTFDGLATIGGNDVGEWVALPGHVNAAFTGSISIRGQAYSAATMNVWVNGVKRGQISLAATDSHLANSTSVDNVPIPAGLVVVRLEVVSGGFSLRSIKIN